MDARHQSSDGRFGAKGWCGSLGLQRSANRRRSSYTHSAPELTATADIRAARTGISNAAPVGLSTGLSPSRLHRFGRFRPSRISECGEPSCYPKRYPKREWAAQERRNDLNYRFIWCRLQESNPRPDDYKTFLGDLSECFRPLQIAPKKDVKSIRYLTTAFHRFPPSCRGPATPFGPSDKKSKGRVRCDLIGGETTWRGSD